MEKWIYFKIIEYLIYLFLNKISTPKHLTIYHQKESQTNYKSPTKQIKSIIHGIQKGVNRLSM